MSKQKLFTRRAASISLTWLLALGPGLLSLAEQPTSPVANGGKLCEDATTAKVQVEPKLSFKFFSTTKTSRPWHIAGDPDEGLEDTADGRIDVEDLILLEHTAGCTSTHQGEHPMNFCEAKSTGDTGLTLLIHGGEPGHFSSLTVDVDTKSRNFTCSFEAVYPSPTPPLTWRITKKAMRVKSLPTQPGHRLYAWISVEFDEVWMENGAEQKQSYKIEGPIKPVIQSPTKKE